MDAKPTLRRAMRVYERVETQRAEKNTRENKTVSLQYGLSIVRRTQAPYKSVTFRTTTLPNEKLHNYHSFYSVSFLVIPHLCGYILGRHSKGYPRMKLKDATIKAAKPRAKPYRLSDGRGLYLEVNPNGSRYWRYRYRLAGKENVAALGVYELGVSLADARKRRDEAAALVEQGIHPARQKKARRTMAAMDAANTFEGVARAWMLENGPHWSARYLENVELYFGKEVFPKLGHLPIKAVKASDVLAILRTMADRGAETAAGLVRMWCSQVFKHAVRNLLAETDPTEVLKGAIRRPPVRHKRPLTETEIGAFVLSLEGYTGQRETAIALHLLALTFVRPGEVRAAEWSEFDLERRLWVIPAERMKMGAEHTVPLSRQAVALLEELRTLTGGRRYLFPNRGTPDAPMGETTLNNAISKRTTIADFSAHGFRATASTLLNAKGYPADVIERQLAHQERDKVRAAYNQAQYIPERTAMMQEWADLIDGFTREARERQGNDASAVTTCPPPPPVSTTAPEGAAAARAAIAQAEYVPEELTPCNA